MKPVIMHIVGNRPQFIKLAPVSEELRKRGYQENIIHTGQHFDENMSDIFFKELDILMPDENLQVSGGSHAEMTARIMLALEPVVIKYKSSRKTKISPAIRLCGKQTRTALCSSLCYTRAFLASEHRRLRYYNFAPLRPGQPTPGFGYLKGSLWFKFRRLRNFYRMCIDYAFRPRLSSRLSLGGRTFPKKP